MNSDVGAKAGERSDAACGGAGVETGKTMPVPKSHEIARRRSEGAAVPVVVWNIDQIKVDVSLELKNEKPQA